jgi:hypothetical protein
MVKKDFKQKIQESCNKILVHLKNFGPTNTILLYA